MRLLPHHKTEAERTGSMTLVEHLQELRYRMVICLYAIAVGAVVGWFLYDRALHLALNPFCEWVQALPKDQRPPTGCRLTYTGLLDSMLIKLKVVAFVGLLVSLPVLLYQLWAFIVPGLTSREKKYSIPFIVSSVALFGLGVVFAIVTLPKALNFLLGFGGANFVPLITGKSYLSFVVLVAIAFGVSFLFPVVLVFLELVGVLSTRVLRNVRRWAILGIAIFAAVITPSSDPYTMLAMMIPMVLFYEAAIIIGRMLKR